MIDDNVKPSEKVSTTSLSLLERAKQEDEFAWRRLCNLYLPLVYQWCRQQGVSAADVPDVGQEVFTSVAANLKGYRRNNEGDSFRAWLRTITRNKVVDHWRQRAGQQEATGGSDAHKRFLDVEFETSCAELSDEGEVALLYRRAMEIASAEFPDWYREAFLLSVVEDWDAKAISQKLGVKDSAVYNAKARVLRRLREEFADVLR